MNRKFYFSLLGLALTVATAVALVVGYNPGTKAAPLNSAVAALPASDFVIVMDARRVLNETLPAVLAGNPAMLARLNTKLSDFERETGINPRSFESLAIGGRISSSSSMRDPRMVIVARGSFNADELLNTAFTALKNRGQLQKDEQQYEGRRIFLLSPSPKQTKSGVAVQQGTTPVLSGEPSTDVIVRTDVKVEKMAVTVLDSNTLAFGNLESVRAAVNASLGRERVDDHLVQMATRDAGAIIGFSGKIPQEITQKAVASSNDPFTKYFSSIREFYGSFSLAGDEAASFVALKTETAEQASELTQVINSFKSLMALGAGRGAGNDPTQNKSLADFLKGLSITAQGNEIQIDLKLSQSSLVPLTRIF
jgi:hypothetical protein